MPKLRTSIVVDKAGLLTVSTPTGIEDSSPWSRSSKDHLCPVGWVVRGLLSNRWEINAAGKTACQDEQRGEQQQAQYSHPQNALAGERFPFASREKRSE